jgi:hypothetical protein
MGGWPSFLLSVVGLCVYAKSVRLEQQQQQQQQQQTDSFFVSLDDLDVSDTRTTTKEETRTKKSGLTENIYNRRSIIIANLMLGCYDIKIARAKHLLANTSMLWLSTLTPKEED